MCIPQRKSVVKSAGNASISYVIGIDVTSLRKRWWNGHDQQDLRRGLPSRESVREIHSHGQTSTQFSIGWHLSIIETLVFSFFRYRFYPFPFIGALWLSPRPPSTHSFFPFPKRVSDSPENMHHTNKTTQAAQRISMLFLSYRRATNERTVQPFFRPFFSELLCFIRGTGTARILLAT